MKRESIDNGWYFTGKAPKISIEEYNDARIIDLPHDFTIESAMSPNAADGGATGFFQGGTGYYTKFLDIPAEWEGSRVLIEIDGAYMNTEVCLNGHFIYLHPYGYTPFHADLTPYLEYGKKNRLSITVNNSAQLNSRWYTGSGLYRNVDLLTAPKVHLSPWSIFAYTNRVENNTAYISVEVTAENHTDKPVTEQVSITLTEEESGAAAVSGNTVVYIPSGKKATAKLSLVVEDAKIWDINSPQLYCVTASLGNYDSDNSLFGIRTISVDTKNGFMLNGRSVKIKGGCVHHDNGILGAASFYDSEYRKMELHKSNGFNAVRCAHNPPSRHMLEACDRLGLLVLNEAFDMWAMQKNTNDYHIYFNSWWKRDMELFITRDRNHPCIFMWSTGNEIVERNGSSNGYALAAELAGYIRSLDPTRPVTNAICTTFNGLNDEDMLKMSEAWKETAQNLGNEFGEKIWGAYTEPFAAVLDTVGYNYLENRYEADGGLYPNRIICGTESFPLSISKVWDLTERLPYVIGDFTWTSYDYIGEAGIGRAVYMEHDEAEKLGRFNNPPVHYPWRLAYCGDFDLCGFGRPQLHYRKIVWGSNETYIAVHNPANMGKKEYISRWGWPEVYPEWSYDGYESNPVKVDVYSASAEVELFLNGNSLGKKPAGKANQYIGSYEFNYEPGILTAISLNGSCEVSRMEIETTGKASEIRITLEKDSIKPDGKSLVYALIEIVDDKGLRVPFDDKLAEASVVGTDAALAAFGTGRPITEENYTDGKFTSFLGRYQAVIRAGHEAGEAILKVKADGLSEAVAVINIK